jgi:dihydrodipicolinate synthase/N-acetylneuraminate lyase
LSIGVEALQDHHLKALRKLACIEQLIVIKEASFDTKSFVDTVLLFESLPHKMSILTGSDTTIFENYVLGADGALIGSAGIATDLSV